jgi:hypothetical protein
VTLRSVRRIDAVSLLRADAAEVSAEGWRFYNAHFARTGSQRYGDKIEYRPDDEVEASFPSFELRPLTDLHPPSNVDSNTARLLARGATSSSSPRLRPAESRCNSVPVTRSTSTRLQASTR